MKFARFFVAALLVPALVSPAFAAGERAVRPSVKAVTAASVAQGRASAVRTSERAGAEAEEDRLFLAGAPLLAVVAGLVGVAVLAAVALGDDPASPGS